MRARFLRDIRLQACAGFVAELKEAPMNPWPHYDTDEIEAVRQLLASGQVSYWTGEKAGILSANSRLPWIVGTPWG